MATAKKEAAPAAPEVTAQPADTGTETADTQISAAAPEATQGAPAATQPSTELAPEALVVSDHSTVSLDTIDSTVELVPDTMFGVLRAAMKAAEDEGDHVERTLLADIEVRLGELRMRLPNDYDSLTEQSKSFISKLKSMLTP